MFDLFYKYSQSIYDCMKYHKVISVDKFVDEYGRNVGKMSDSKVLIRIERNQGAVKELIKRLRKDMNDELDSF